MKKQGINLFIVDDNQLVISDLKIFLNYKFGKDIHISTFTDGDECLAQVNKDTDIVILDYFLNGRNGLEILKEIKAKSPKTEVIMFSGNDDVANAIQSFRNGASDYIIKGEGALKKISNLVYHILTEPIRIIAREFKVTKYVAIFILTFFIMGIIVAIVLYNMK